MPGPGCMLPRGPRCADGVASWRSLMGARFWSFRRQQELSGAGDGTCSVAVIHSLQLSLVSYSTLAWSLAGHAVTLEGRLNTRHGLLVALSYVSESPTAIRAAGASRISNWVFCADGTRPFDLSSTKGLHKDASLRLQGATGAPPDATARARASQPPLVAQWTRAAPRGAPPSPSSYRKTGREG